MIIIIELLLIGRIHSQFIIQKRQDFWMS